MKSSGYIKKTIRLMLCVGILFNFQFSIPPTLRAR